MLPQKWLSKKKYYFYEQTNKEVVKWWIMLCDVFMTTREKS